MQRFYHEMKHGDMGKEWLVYDRTNTQQGDIATCYAADMANTIVFALNKQYNLKSINRMTTKARMAVIRR